MNSLFEMMIYDNPVDMDEFVPMFDKHYVPHKRDSTHGATLLMVACMIGHLNVVKHLIKSFPDEQTHLDLKCHRSEMSALNYALRRGIEEIVEELLKAHKDQKRALLDAYQNLLRFAR